MAKKVISTGGYPVDMSSGEGITPEEMASMTMNISQIRGFGEAGLEIAEADTADEVKAILGVKDGSPGPANKLKAGLVTLLPAGSQPTVTITGDAPNQTINFGLPASKDGASPTLKVGAVSTLSPGSAATAEITGTAPNFIVNFGIPQGATPSAAAAIQTETVSGVVATAGAKVAVKFTKTYTAPPNVTPYNAIVNGQLVIGVPSDVTATGCNVIVVQTRGTLLLTTGPIENSPAGTAFRINVIGY